MSRSQVVVRPALPRAIISSHPRHGPLPGLHWVEWGCEFLGTALLLIGGLSAICFDFGPHGPVSSNVTSTSARLLITGLLFAGTGSLVAISPLGRRSGAHLNPALTFAFWLRGNVHVHDLLGYTAAQFVGAMAGTTVVALAWGDTARNLRYGATVPGHGLDEVQASGVEALMTAALVLAILLMTSHQSTARWTPLIAWLLIAALVWQGAPYSGTSLNPARSFAPAWLGREWQPYWVYVAGPLLGAVLAAALHQVLPGERPVTAKVFHDSSYPSTFGGSAPVVGR